MDASPRPDAQSADPRPVERWLLHRLLSLKGAPPIAMVLWNGEEVRVGSERPLARVRLLDRALLREILLRPSIAFGDAYADGRLEVEGDLVTTIESVFRSNPSPPRRVAGLLRARNTTYRSRHNVHHHYDVGNDFYALWLDPTLSYTCAYFPRREAGLEEAQIAKMDHVCRKVALRPGERVLEAGCGWGSLALHMAERYGVTVRAFNVSSEQVRYAREQARLRRLESRVEFVEDDYRNASGRYDVFVSVGMLEHVGRRHYRTLGRVIHRCLAPHGRGLLHSIGRARPQPMNAWIERRIFPGAYIPSLREMLLVLEPDDLVALDVENLRLHYARTLEHWLDRFEKAADSVRAMFDERFVRTWRLYLASSIAAFRTGSTQLFQVVFTRARNGRIPWTRAHVYDGADEEPWSAATS